VDNLTHTLAGAVLGEAGLKRRTPLAMPTLMIGANLPDVDVVAMLFSSGLAYRRGWTHGVLALVVLPIVLTFLMLAWDRWRRRRSADPHAPVAVPREILLLATIGILSHPFLDWLNNYGMRWLMPFDGRWFYGDAVFIIDPWLWLVLIGGVILARRRRSPRIGLTALVSATLYIGVMLGLSSFGREVVRRELLTVGLTPDRMMVGPIAIDPTRRQVIVHEGETYHRGTLRFLPAPRLEMSERAIAANLDHPLFPVIAADPDAIDFLRWSRFPFFIVEPGTDGLTLWLDDLRYSGGSSPSWAAVRMEIEPPETIVAGAP
jgi:inner membrane protein